MNEAVDRGLGNGLWGIYHLDREYAREMGDPLRTVIEAPNKMAAEEAAARLGFGEAWAQPIAPDQAQQAQWLPGRRPGHR
ncbi:MAG: hypothetical protein J0M24_00135 [Verrucomicrobia bacterium]|nr:hypothetical protein [Verrucomicrobiota bacterium]